MAERTTPIMVRVPIELRKFQMAHDSKGLKPEWNLSKLITDIMNIVMDLPSNGNATVPIRFYALDGKLRMTPAEGEN